MIWRLLIACALFNGAVRVAYADEPSVVAEDAVVMDTEPAVVNDAPNAQQEAVDLIDVLNPTIEAIYDFEGGEWHVGTSASVYDFTSHAIHLGRLKAGYMSANAFYGGVDVDVPGLVSRYLGGRWGQLDTVLETTSKYGSFGYIVGYDPDASRIRHGISLGATVRF